MTKMVNDYNNGVFVAPSKNTLKDYLERWLKDIALPNMTPHNFEGYEFNIRKYIIPILGNVLLTNLKSSHIKKLIADIKRKGTIEQHKLSSML